MIAHRFEFRDDAQALRFVHRLVVALRELAICRDKTVVYVLDGADRPQTEQIERLARASSARWKTAGRGTG